MNYSLSVCLLCLSLTAGWAWGLPSGMDSQAVGHNTIQAKDDLLDGIYTDCVNKGSVSCIKYKLFAYVDKALDRDEINLTEGVTVVRTSGNPGDGAPRSLQDGGESAAANGDVDAMVVKRVQRFLNEHSIKVDIKGADIVNAVSRTGKSITDAISQFVGEDEGGVSEESRGKKKKKNKALMQLFMLLKFKLIALLPFILGKIALIAGKALLIGKIALVLSLIVVLQKVLSQHKKTVTYEVLPQAHHDVHGHDSYSSGGGADVASGGYGGGSASGGWGRSMDAQQMAYSAQAPLNTQ